MLTMCSDEDDDWFKVAGSAGDQITANVAYEPTEGMLEMYLYSPTNPNYSIDSDWEYPASASGALRVEHTVAGDAQPGDYRIMLVGYDWTGDTSFTNVYNLDLSVTRACANDSHEPSDLTEPEPINVGETFANLALCGETDIYVVPAGAGGPITICADFVHANGNIDMFVATDIAFANGVGFSQSTDDDERVFVNAAAATAHYIKIVMTPVGNTSYGLIVSSGNVACP
jgi:hypothetical protein